MSDQTKTDIRKERNEGKSKGYAALGMRKMKVSEALADIGGDADVFVMVIGLDEHCRTDVDVRDVMKERNILGTVFPMRNMKPITQSEKTVTMFE